MYQHKYWYSVDAWFPGARHDVEGPMRTISSVIDFFPWLLKYHGACSRENGPNELYVAFSAYYTQGASSGILSYELLDSAREIPRSNSL